MCWDEADIQEYENELRSLVSPLHELIVSGCTAEINAITDKLLGTERRHCDAGRGSYTLAPDGCFYICPAFYYEEQGFPIGSMNSGISGEIVRLLDPEKSPLCGECNQSTCTRCLFTNILGTKEVNIPPTKQCRIAKLENSVAGMLLKRLNST